MSISKHRLDLPPEAEPARDFIEAPVARYESQIEELKQQFNRFPSRFSLSQSGFKVSVHQADRLSLIAGARLRVGSRCALVSIPVLKEILLMSRFASSKTARIWGERIAQCERSNTPVAQFCQSINCSPTSYD